MVEALPPAMTAEEFLDFIDLHDGPEGWELHDGVPRMMVGGTYAHSVIAGNIDVALRSAARAKGCQTLRDMLVKIGPKTAFGPDLVIRCGPAPLTMRLLDGAVVVFEVLSRSTMRIDRGTKFDGYETLGSLRQIVHVYQDSVRVESWRRLGTDEWRTEPDVLRSRGDRLRIERLGCDLALGDVYDGLDL